MKSPAKWLVAGGAFLLAFAFFLPFINVVSNSTELSLRQIAGAPYLFYLYMFPLGAFTTLILSLLPNKIRTARNLFLIGQFLGLGLSLLLLLSILAYLIIWSFSQQDPLNLGSILPGECQTTCEVWPGIGFFVVLFGFCLATIGLFFNNFPIFVRKPILTGQSLASEDASPSEQRIHLDVNFPRLEFLKGEMANQTFTVSEDNYSIGRSKTNQLQLIDSSRMISRVHARLRFAQKNWFIQDQDSKIGTFVNGERIKAVRLKSGDEIKIGENTLIFRD